MIVEGSPTAVSALVDQMLDATKEVGGRSRHCVVDGVQVAANIAAFRQTHREYFEFSGRAVRLLKDHKAIAADAEAERLGAVVGDRATLQPLVD